MIVWLSILRYDDDTPEEPTSRRASILEVEHRFAHFAPLTHAQPLVPNEQLHQRTRQQLIGRDLARRPNSSPAAILSSPAVISRYALERSLDPARAVTDWRTYRYGTE
jgi:hypothetical protein